MNPFMGRFPVERYEDWFGSQENFRTLEGCIQQRVNAVILGPAGSGKTSLLRTMFSYDYCQQLAMECKILVCEASLQNMENGEAICAYLADQILEQAEGYLGDLESTQALLRDLKRIDDVLGQQCLSKRIAHLYRRGYFVVLIMNHFEHFTTSLQVTQEHHEVLRSLIDSNRLQCIAATNYDLSQDSLQPNMPGSYLLQKFTKSILMHPLSVQDSIALLNRCQSRAQWKMPDKLMEALHSLSGGIPWVLKAAAQQIYDHRPVNEGTLDVAKANQAIYEACIPMFRSWCKYLTDYQIQVLDELASRMGEGDNSRYAVMDFSQAQSDLLTAAAALKNRGLLRQTEYPVKSGGVRFGPDYELRFNCLLFQRFCRDGLARQTGQENPLKRFRLESQQRAQLLQEAVLHDARMRQLEEEKMRVQIQQAHQMPAGNTTYVHIDHMEVVQGITAKQLMDLLSSTGDSQQMFSQQLSSMLRKNLSFLTLSQPLQGLGEAAQAQQMDELWNQAGSQLLQDVQVDEEQDFVDITPDQLKNLDHRFYEARDRCRRALTDAILETQSERCQFYLKLSVVVEDALALPGVQMEDYSPQLVFYGKALEQSLRDNLYELFHRDQELSVYNTISHTEDPDSRDVFRNKPVGKTLLGNYEYLIAGKKGRLDHLCQVHSVQAPGRFDKESWTSWWERLQYDIRKAREIRNLMGHAGENSPTWEKLDEMCRLLMGSSTASGILERVTIGKQLTWRLVPQKIPPQVIEQMVGSVCDMECTARKSNGGLRGITCQGGYPVNISPRLVQRYRMNGGAKGSMLVGKRFRVRLLEYKVQNQQEFFRGDLVAEEVACTAAHLV